MANQKISELTEATNCTGAELVSVVQGGTTKKAPLNTRVKAYFDTLYTPVAKVTSPVSWTPTFTGFGTVSGVTAYSWRVGSMLHFEITFTSGTSTGTEVRVSLGFNGVDGSVTTASTYPALQQVGDGSSNTGTSPYTVLAEASRTYIMMGVQDGSGGARAGFSKRNGNVLAASGWITSIRGAVRIQGW